MFRNHFFVLTAIMILVVTGPGLIGKRGLENAEGVKVLRQAIFEAEDSRAANETALNILIEAAKNPDMDIRGMAVRALGRLERPSLGEFVIPLLSDPEALVRAEAANALGQSDHALRSVGRSGNPDQISAAAFVKAAADRLSDRLDSERDPMVRGVIAQTLGRLPYQDEAGLQLAEAIILSVSGSPSNPMDPDQFPAFQGAAKGFEALLRLNAKTMSPGPDTVARLKSFVTGSLKNTKGDPSIIESAAFIRRLALTALASSKRIDESILDAAAVDPDDQVRRLAIAALRTVPEGSISSEKIEHAVQQGLKDQSGIVRYEALRCYGRMMPAFDPGGVLPLVEDPSSHVALLAIDLLGQDRRQKDQPGHKGRPEAGDVAELLQGLSENLSGSGRAVSGFRVAKTWHGAAHALISLAEVEPDSARMLLPDFVSSGLWPVRMYAARAAAILKDVPALETLAADSHDNVCEAALSELAKMKGHEIDALLIAALNRPCYQLIMTAARGLKECSSPEKALPDLLATLERLTIQKRDTSRDPRLALLERIGELGSAAQADALAVFTEDFDPRIAEAAAAVIEQWTGRKPEIRPHPLPLSHAGLESVEMLRDAVVRISMAGKGAFELRMLVDEAPAAVSRFVKLVKAGYYNGLTFHRIIPNFIIQGGSPGANEFVGDGPYMRDEIGRESHRRGTVGISTRGRDTGDAQIFLNVVDNVRLDHDYTVFARVISGMEVVDNILECDVIERIDVIL